MFKKVMVVFLLYLGGVNLACADELGDLKQQVAELRQDYETQIQGLQQKIEALSQKQETAQSEFESKLEKKIEEKTVSAEYVGRYEGPFRKGGFLLKNPSGFGNVSVGGYGSLEFENFENANSTFDQARFILNIGAQPHERLLFYSEFEIEHGGTNYPGGDGEVKVEQAWASYNINDWMNLKGGIVLVPFGKFNLLHDDDIQDLTERPLVARRVIPSTWTDAGFGLLGELPIGETLNWKLLPDFYLNYEAYVVNGLDEDISDTGLRNARGSASNDLNNTKDLVGRLGFGLSRNLELGLTGYFGKYGRSGSATRNGNNNIVGLGSDVNFKRGPFELVGDFAYWGFEDGALIDHDNDNVAGDEVSAPQYMRGFYIEPRYHFWPKFLNNTFWAGVLRIPSLP